MKSQTIKLMLAIGGLTHAGISNPVRVAEHNPLAGSVVAEITPSPGSHDRMWAFSLLSGVIGLGLAVGGMTDPEEGTEQEPMDHQV